MTLNDAITHSLNIAVSDCSECGKEQCKECENKIEEDEER